MKTQTEVPDYVLAKQEIEAYFATLGLLSRNSSGTPSTDASGWKHNAWRFTFEPAQKPSKVSIALPFKTGTGIKETPKACEVLASAARDALSVCVPFEEWADEFGYDSDSRKAEAIYKECVSLYLELGKLLTKTQMGKLAVLSTRL